VANRIRSEMEDMIGYFTNNVVLRNNLSGSPTFADLLQQTRVTVLDAFADQEVPFSKVSKALRSNSGVSEPPLFQAMVLVQNTPDATLELQGLTISLQGIDNGTTKFERLLAIEETETGLIGSIVYSTDLFEASTIRQMVTDLHLCLEQVVEQPTCKITDIRLSAKHEKQVNA
jgi:non-ribosomal peptide synthetase component F